MYTAEAPQDPALPVWPNYGRVDEGQSELTQRELNFVRAQFAGKVTMVDRWFGRILEQLTALDLWEETMVIVTSDHGHFLGEHGWIGKPTAPDYNVLTRTPLLIWHPQSPRMGDRVDELTSAVDLHDTILDVLGGETPDETHSRSLLPFLEGETDVHREWALYGWWGSTINVTDGRYTYMHPCSAHDSVHCYSTSQMNPWGWMGPKTPKEDAESGRLLPYTDAPVWRFSAPPDPAHEEPLLFDVRVDPRQLNDLTGENSDQVERMRNLLLEGMEELQAPEDQYERFGFER
jgi:hypothetical protein